jgi:hypothetical protein
MTEGIEDNRSGERAACSMRLSGAKREHLRTGGPGTPSERTPEALVQREDRALLVLKALFVLVLLIAAAAATSLIFLFTRDSQRRSFESDFSAAAQSIGQTLVEDLAFFFSSGQSVSTALTVIMAAYNAMQLTMSVPIPMFKSLTNDARLKAFYATWNPLLRNDQERKIFEEMVREKETEGYFSDGINPICFVCGNEDFAPSTPSTLITFPGIGSYTCGELDRGGRAALFEVTACPIVTKAAMEGCSCSFSSADHSETKVDRKPSRGLYQISGDVNHTVVDEPWTGGPYLPMWLDSAVFELRDPLLFDHLSHSKSAEAVTMMLFTGYPQVTRMYNVADPHYYSLGMLGEQPASTFFSPVKSPYGPDIVGAVSISIRWETLLRKKVPKQGNWVSIVIESSCGDVHSYGVHESGIEMIWMGKGDLHDHRYDHLVYRTSYEDFSALVINAAGSTDHTPDAIGFPSFPLLSLKINTLPMAPGLTRYQLWLPSCLPPHWSFCTTTLSAADKARS